MAGHSRGSGVQLTRPLRRVTVRTRSASFRSSATIQYRSRVEAFPTLGRRRSIDYSRNWWDQSAGSHWRPAVCRRSGACWTGRPVAAGRASSPGLVPQCRHRKRSARGRDYSSAASRGMYSLKVVQTLLALCSPLLLDSSSRPTEKHLALRFVLFQWNFRPLRALVRVGSSGTRIATGILDTNRVHWLNSRLREQRGFSRKFIERRCSLFVKTCYRSRVDIDLVTESVWSSHDSRFRRLLASAGSAQSVAFAGLTYGLIIFGAQERERERERHGIGTITFRVAVFRAISRCGRTHISVALVLARNALCRS